MEYDLKKFKHAFKGIRNNMILVSIAAIVVGVIAIFAPAVFNQIICYVIAGLLCAVGLYTFIIYLIADSTDSFGSFGMVKGITALAFGVLLFVNPSFVTGVLGIVLGISMIIDGAVKLQYAIDLLRIKVKEGWAILIPAVAVTILGIVIIAANNSANAFIVFIGITLVIDGISDLFTIWRLSKFAKDAASAVAPVAEIVDAELNNSDGQ